MAKPSPWGRENTVSLQPHRDLRIALIGLQTDMENAAPELEPLYRVSLEDAIEMAKGCHLNEAITQYTEAISTGKLIENRLGTGYGGKFLEIEELAKAAIIEALVAHCGCDIKSVE